MSIFSNAYDDSIILFWMYTYPTTNRLLQEKKDKNIDFSLLKSTAQIIQYFRVII